MALKKLLKATLFKIMVSTYVGKAESWSPTMKYDTLDSIVDSKTCRGSSAKNSDSV
jgi:hypothetical protein